MRTTPQTAGLATNPEYGTSRVCDREYAEYLKRKADEKKAKAAKTRKAKK